MKKQLIFTLIGLLAVILIFVFGRTVVPKTSSAPPVVPLAKVFNIKQFIEEAKQHLTESQTLEISKLENSVIRGDVTNQQVIANTQLANFFIPSAKDTLG